MCQIFTVRNFFKLWEEEILQIIFFPICHSLLFCVLVPSRALIDTAAAGCPMTSVPSVLPPFSRSLHLPQLFSQTYLPTIVNKNIAGFNIFYSDSDFSCTIPTQIISSNRYRIYCYYRKIFVSYVIRCASGIPQ